MSRSVSVASSSFLDRNSLTDAGDLTNADLYNDAIYDL